MRLVDLQVSLSLVAEVDIVAVFSRRQRHIGPGVEDRVEFGDDHQTRRHRRGVDDHRVATGRQVVDKVGTGRVGRGGEDNVVDGAGYRVEAGPRDRQSDRVEALFGAVACAVGINVLPDEIADRAGPRVGEVSGALVGLVNVGRSCVVGGERQGDLIDRADSVAIEGGSEARQIGRIDADPDEPVRKVGHEVGAGRVGGGRDHDVVRGVEHPVGAGPAHQNRQTRQARIPDLRCIGAIAVDVEPHLISDRGDTPVAEIDVVAVLTGGECRRERCERYRCRRDRTWAACRRGDRCHRPRPCTSRPAGGRPDSCRRNR